MSHELNSHIFIFFIQISFALMGLTFCDVSHLALDKTTEKYYPPQPYHFQYEAGRAPGHVDSKYLIL